MRSETLRRYLRTLLAEDQSTDDIVVASFRLLTATTGEEPNVTDVFNAVRAIEGVTVVKQMGAAQYTSVSGGRHVLLFTIKFFPTEKDPSASTITLAKKIKSLKAVNIVKVLSVGGTPLTKDDGKSYVF